MDKARLIFYVPLPAFGGLRNNAGLHTLLIPDFLPVSR